MWGWKRRLMKSKILGRKVEIPFGLSEEEKEESKKKKQKQKKERLYVLI